MAQNSQFIVFLFFLLGCSAVLGENMACPDSAIEACMMNMNNLKNTSTEILCQTGILDTTLECFAKMKDSCEMTEEQNNMVNKTVSEIEISKKGCPNAGGQPASGQSTCEAPAVRQCHMTMGPLSEPPSNDTDLTQKCSIMKQVVSCMEGALTNCQNVAMKAQLEGLLESIKKNMTEMKCCAVVAVQNCVTMKYDITNETVSQENCNSLTESNNCLSKTLDDCEDVKKSEEPAMKSIAIGLDLCEEKGFTGGDATTTRPLLGLLVAACLMVLSTFI